MTLACNPEYQDSYNALLGSSLYGSWKKANRNAAADYEKWVAGLQAGSTDMPPSSVYRTQFGTHLGKEGELALKIIKVQNQGGGGSGGGILGTSLPAVPPRGTQTRTVNVTAGSATSLQTAFNNLQAGDHVIVPAGTYCQSGNTGGFTVMFLINSKNGNSNNPIWIDFQPGAVINGIDGIISGTNMALYITLSSYIFITGAEVTNYHGTGVQVTNKSHHIVLDGCYIHDTADAGFVVEIQPGADTSDIFLLNSEFRNHGSIYGGAYAYFHGIANDHWQDGIHSVYWGSSSNTPMSGGETAKNGMIANCRFHDDSWDGSTKYMVGGQIQLGGVVDGLVVTNCTLARNRTRDATQATRGAYRGNGFNFWGVNTNVKMVNCIVTHASGYALNNSMYGGQTGNELRNNVFFSNDLGDIQGTTGLPMSTPNYTIDPGLGAGDVPASRSVFAGKADLAYIYPTDKNGAARNTTTPSLGCLEAAAA